MPHAVEKVVAQCRSCGAEIVWLKTQAGKNMPVDRKRLDGGDAAEDVHRWKFDRDRHVSHFSSCPNGEQHRKKR